MGVIKPAALNPPFTFAHPTPCAAASCSCNGLLLNGFGFILDTVSAQHTVDDFLQLLKRDGTLCMVGASPEPLPVQVFSLIMKRRQFSGSLIGGITESQEVLDFCAQHGLSSDVEIIPMLQINQANERMLKSDVKYRFVIDMASLKG